MTDPNYLEQQGRALAVQVNAVQVVDGESFQLAAEFLRGIKQYVKKVGDLLDPIVESANKAHKTAVAQRKSLLEPAQGAERIIKERMGAYEQAERRRAEEAERLAREEQERLEREAREEARREQERLERLAEDAALEAAADAEEHGDTAAAERLLDAPIFVPPVVPQPVFVPRPVVQAPTAPGVSFREQWDYEVVNERAIPREYLMTDHKKIAGVARATRGSVQIPGVRIFRTTGVAAKA